MAALHEQGYGDVAGVQGQADDLGAFRNENALFRLQPVAQLGLGEPGEEVQLRGGDVSDLYDSSHSGLLLCQQDGFLAFSITRTAPPANGQSTDGERKPRPGELGAARGRNREISPSSGIVNAGEIYYNNLNYHRRVYAAEQKGRWEQ